ncbi:hypothetical protein niasHT_029715 [Heterodera trifolii]|uniref:G-protein coupled receptors family 1 profile domain-containing protein n=1 Tax=Heterodera trifolii TaxID=157864 RepID=A0ABD2KQN3_9BILA
MLSITTTISVSASPPLLLKDSSAFSAVLPLLSNASSVVVASAFVRLFGSVSYALLSLMSILLNWLLITVLCYGHYQFRRMAFFTIAWQMVICDLMTQTVQIIVAVPITFTGEAVYGHPFWYYAVLFFDTVAYNATLHFSALLTFNRICVFFVPRLNDFLFSYPNIFGTIFVLWLYVFLFCSCYILIGCRKNFSETGFFMFHDCPPQLPPAGILFRQISWSLSTYLPVLMLFSYLLIFVYVRYFVPFPQKIMAAPPAPRGEKFCIKTAAAKMAEEYAAQIKRKQEIQFLIQSFLICGFLEVQNLTFAWTPSLFSSLNGQWPFLVTFSENWISILLNSISPIILFSFNIDVRRIVRQLFGPFFLSFRCPFSAADRLAPAGVVQVRHLPPARFVAARHHRKIVKSLQEKGKVLDLVRYENKLSHYKNVLENIEIQLKQKLEFLKNSCNENSINIYGDHLHILDSIELNLSKVQVKFMERDITNAAQLWTLDKRPIVLQSLWVIRHGHRLDNIDKKLCTEDELARDDIPLSPLGIQQSQELGKRFENVTISKVFSSPFSRSVKTAIGLLGGAETKSHAISINIEPGLAELHVPCSFLLGYYEVPELVKKFPLLNPKYWPLFNKRTLSALQSVNQVEEEDCKFVIKKTISQILADNKNAEHIVLSTHGAFTAYLHEILTGEWTIVGQSSVTKFVRYYDENDGEKDDANYADKIRDKLRMEFTSDVTHLSDPYNTRPF